MARPQKQIRGKQLVARVMAATIAELARSGMDGLSIEDVAVRAGRRPRYSRARR